MADDIRSCLKLWNRNCGADAISTTLHAVRGEVRGSKRDPMATAISLRSAHDGVPAPDEAESSPAGLGPIDIHGIHIMAAMR